MYISELDHSMENCPMWSYKLCNGGYDSRFKIATLALKNGELKPDIRSLRIWSLQNGNEMSIAARLTLLKSWIDKGLIAEVIDVGSVIPAYHANSLPSCYKRHTALYSILK